jgi:hypothetical protein
MLYSRFHYIYFYLCYVFIYFYVYYDANFMNLNREHSSYKDGILFFEPRTSSLLSNRKCSIFISLMFVKFFYLNIPM